MPLLVCPNDSASMQTVQRNGVEFDFCPTCRGVWLDRGELEKMMAASQADAGYDDRPPEREPRRAEPERRREEYRDERDERRAVYRDDDDDHRHRRRKGFSLFDIFD